MKKVYKIRFRWLLLLFVIASTATIPPLFCDYPEIKAFNSEDPLYRQLQDDVSTYYKAIHSNGKDTLPALTIYRWQVDHDLNLDIFSLSARVNIPYDTIVTLNHFNNPGQCMNVKSILIPNIPGLFIPENPLTELDRILISWRRVSEEASEKVIINISGKKEIFLFFPGKRFHPVERAYFLYPRFIFPLPKGRITSFFGNRQSPFSGHKEVHNGIDIGAKEGTEVLSVRDGIVTKMGVDEIYGNYVLISHADGFQSFYGHLKDFYVHLYMKVFSGMVIGRVGTTGRSTGPHLHFEIRKNGSRKDPLPFFQ